MQVLEFSKIRDHFKSIEAGSQTGHADPKDIRHTLEKDMSELAKQVNDTRRGNVEDSFGNKLSPMHISLTDAVRASYGIPDLATYLKALGVYTSDDTLFSLGRRFGQDNLSKTITEQLMVDASEFNSAPNTTGNVAADYRFIIPEIFTEAIRTGYEHVALHNSWIAGTQNMSTRSLKMPRIERGDGMPSKVSEGGDIPVGSIRFGKKDVSIYKIGTGFQITDELVMESKLNMLFIFLQEVGNDMSIGADVAAIKCLVNGEQADGSESAPVIGVETANNFETLDAKRVMSRMARLKRALTHAVLNEEDSLLDLNEAKPEREETSIEKYMGIKTSNWILPGNQLLFLNAQQAMMKLQYRGMMTERRRNPRNQTEELFISDHINFAIVKRDARIIMDKDLAFASNGFPAYMDIDSRINTAFNEL